MKILHPSFGEGQIINSTEVFDEEGHLVSCDIMFEHGIEQGVDADELQEITKETMRKAGRMAGGALVGGAAGAAAGSAAGPVGAAIGGAMGAAAGAAGGARKHKNSSYNDELNDRFKAEGKARDQAWKNRNKPMVIGKKTNEEKELTSKQEKNLDVNHDGHIGADDLAALRNHKIPPEDRHFKDQSPRMQTAINLHLRKGKGYWEAVDAAKKHVKEETELTEKLTKNTSAETFIRDFLKSDNPKFAGKSPEKRREMALAAYYAMHKEETELEEGMKRLDKVNIIYHDDDPETKKFANDYKKGHAGMYKTIGSSTDADAEAEDKFHDTYNRKTVRSGFGGSGTHIYTHKQTGKKFAVDISPNGRTFYGNDHRITAADHVNEEVFSEARGRRPKNANPEAGEEQENAPGLMAQLHKHKDLVKPGGTGVIHFKDGKANVTAEHREKALEYLRGLMGPGKSPDARDKAIKEMSKSHAHFLHHIGAGPKPADTKHPMSIATEAKKMCPECHKPMDQCKCSKPKMEETEMTYENALEILEHAYELGLISEKELTGYYIDENAPASMFRSNPMALIVNEGKMKAAMKKAGAMVKQVGKEMLGDVKSIPAGIKGDMQRTHKDRAKGFGEAKVWNDDIAASGTDRPNKTSMERDRKTRKWVKKDTKPEDATYVPSNRDKGKMRTEAHVAEWDDDKAADKKDEVNKEDKVYDRKLKKWVKKDTVKKSDAYYLPSQRKGELDEQRTSAFAASSRYRAVESTIRDIMAQDHNVRAEAQHADYVRRGLIKDD